MRIRAAKTLEDSPFTEHFSINFPFPKKYKEELIQGISSLPDDLITRQIEKTRQPLIEQEIAKVCYERGYVWSRDKPDECKLWLPDFKNQIDFYCKEKRIGIEVEKTEVKRVLHDVLKLVNGSMTFVPKIEYGVLIFPDEYRTKSEYRPFRATVEREIPFYFSKIIPENCNLRDLLLIAYDTATLSTRN